MNGHPPPLVPPYLGIPLLLALFAAAVYAVIMARRAALRRAWAAVAGRLGGALEGAPGSGAMRVRGTYRGSRAFLGQGISYEDPAPYPHTRGALSVANPAAVVLGLRRKSMLEEFSSRRDLLPLATGDPDFDRAFFLALSTPEHLALILPPHIRKELIRYGDVEVYLRGDQIAWRRADTVRSSAEMLRLFDTIADIGESLRTLPSRELTLIQKLEEEKLIEHGV